MKTSRPRSFATHTHKHTHTGEQVSKGALSHDLCVDASGRCALPNAGRRTYRVRTQTIIKSMKKSIYNLANKNRWICVTPNTTRQSV